MFSGQCPLTDCFSIIVVCLAKVVESWVKEGGCMAACGCSLPACRRSEVEGGGHELRISLVLVLHAPAFSGCGWEPVSHDSTLCRLALANAETVCWCCWQTPVGELACIAVYPSSSSLLLLWCRRTVTRHCCCELRPVLYSVLHIDYS